MGRAGVPDSLEALHMVRIEGCPLPFLCVLLWRSPPPKEPVGTMASADLVPYHRRSRKIDGRRSRGPQLGSLWSNSSPMASPSPSARF